MANKVDMKFQPATYWSDSLSMDEFLSHILGKARQDEARRGMEEQGLAGLTQFLVKQRLTSEEREAWGGIHGTHHAEGVDAALGALGGVVEGEERGMNARHVWHSHFMSSTTTIATIPSTAKADSSRPVRAVFATASTFSFSRSSACETAVWTVGSIPLPRQALGGLEEGIGDSLGAIVSEVAG